MSTVADLFFEKANAYAARDALRVRGREITYGELAGRALTVAAALRECGAERETIGLVGQRKPSSYFGIAGILAAGCNYTPINPKYNKARVLAILRDAGVRFLVGDGEDLQLLAPSLADSSAPHIELAIVPEGDAPKGMRTRNDASLRTITPLDRPVSIPPSDLAYLLYTSGSTGIPKGVQVTNANLLAFLRSMSGIYELEPGFHASQTYDFSFDLSVSDMFFTWTRGGILCVLPEEEVLLPNEYICREKITFWNSVPSIANFMLKMGHLSPGMFPDLQYSMFCGEQFPRHLADAWRLAAPNSTVENLYGPTETTIYITRHVYSEADRTKSFKNSIVPIGRPFIDHECAVVGELGQKVMAGQMGELAFKGPQITDGYLHDSEKTESVFVTFTWDESGAKWYKTGDLGFVNEDGNLECMGRRDSQIKLGGRRVEIGEIEAALARFPATRDAVVVPLRDENEIVIGCVAFTTNVIEKDDELRIRRESAEFLERVFFPRKLITIEAIPVSPSGKTDRKALAALAQRIISGGAAKGER